MLLLFLLLFALLAVGQDISFINPGPAGANSEYANNPSFAYGSTLDIQWTLTSDSISLVLYQQTQSAEFEYIFQNQVGLSSYSWTVSPTKDLDVSRIFFFQIFITGETAPTTASHYFNITGDATSTASSSSSSSAASASSSASSTSLTTPLTTSTGTAPESNATPTPPPTPPPDGLSTGAKIGLGVGIPLGVIALALFGWFIFVLWKNAKNNAHLQRAYHQPMMRYDYQQNRMYPPQGSFVKEPTELHAPHVERGPVEFPNHHCR